MSAMDKRIIQQLFLICSTVAIVFIIILFKNVNVENKTIPKIRPAPTSCLVQISEDTITPLNNTKHLLVSAFVDQRLKGFDIRIIGIFRRDSIKPLYCVFCCAGNISATTPTTISQHSDDFGFPFVTTDVLCQIPGNCNPAYVTLLTEPDGVTLISQHWLPIRNRKDKEDKEKKLKFDFTVCLSVLFGGYNNVLQTVQTLEMYRLLGVGRVVVYNKSIGPDLDRLLQSYSQEGFVEVVQWPIHKYLNPSRGWLYSKSGGDMHYHGQQTVINECIYRTMDQSKYILLNDIDEIIMPYQHNNLADMMKMLQQQHPNAKVFFIQNRVFSTNFVDPSQRFKLSQWNGVPGINILEHIYKEEPGKLVYTKTKLIIDPRAVEQTSVHQTLKTFGGYIYVQAKFCHMIHVRPGLWKKENLTEDKRLWNFSEELIPNVNKHLKQAELLSPEEEH